MKEKLRLYEIGLCLRCGRSKPEILPTRDHFIPQEVLNIPHNESVTPETHPLSGVVHRWSNLFTLCDSCHRKVDSKKMRAFRGDNFNKVDPVALINYLQNEYPITLIEQYRARQIKMIRETYLAFTSAVNNMDGQLGPVLKEKYLRAAELADATSQKLRLLL